MSDNPAVPRKGEILAPERGGVVRDSDRSMVVSVFSRVRNQVIQKELASYLDKARTWNEIVAALRDGERLRQEYQAALVRSEHLPLLRAAEEAKVLSEVQRIFDEEADRQKERQLHNKRLDAELIRAQRELDALTKTPDAAPKESRGKRRAKRIKDIRDEREEMIAAFTGGKAEAELTDEERDIVANIRLASDNEIKRFLEEDRD
jgi:uncharacterized protein YfcZ (UPF0381/DUF406 family)